MILELDKSGMNTIFRTSMDLLNALNLGFSVYKLVSMLVHAAVERTAWAQYVKQGPHAQPINSLALWGCSETGTCVDSLPCLFHPPQHLIRRKRRAQHTGSSDPEKPTFSSKRWCLMLWWWAGGWDCLFHAASVVSVLAWIFLALKLSWLPKSWSKEGN
jgi:hypothetical protein